MTLADENREHLDSAKRRLVGFCRYRERITNESLKESGVSNSDLIGMMGDPGLSLIARYAAAGNVRVRLTFEPVEGT